MRFFFTTAGLLLITNVFSQVFKEKELKTTIQEVTVFINGAQIFESGSTAIPAGKTTLKLKNLSPYLDEKSIQVKGSGDFTILSVNHHFNFLGELKRDEKIDSLRKAYALIELSISRENARLAVLEEKQSVLSENKKIGGTSSGVSVVQLKQAIDLYESEVTKIKEEQLRITQTTSVLNQRKSQIEQQLRELNNAKTLPSSEVEIRISSETQTSAKINLTYLVANAGWYPKYDVRVNNIEKPLELTYKAEVYQNTGVDWNNVKLRFSNGDPRQSGVLPELSKWNLTFARNTISTYELPDRVTTVKGTVVSDEDGSPLPGVNVVVKGTTIGTVTDAYGNYTLTLPNNASTLLFSFVGLMSLEIPISKSDINIRMQPDVTQLSEVVVTGYGYERQARKKVKRDIENSVSTVSSSPIIATRIVENQTTVEIEVATPYSIKSDGEKLQVELKKHDINAFYQYYAVPKLEKDAFLVAHIVDWDQYNLLEGEANLYFEDGYVGRTILNAKSLEDTLTISLGRDKNVIVLREKNGQFSKRKTIGSNTIEMRNFVITVRNKKPQAIQLAMFDQIPVSISSDIIVDPTELSKGSLDPESGKVKWEITIEKQQQKEFVLQYEVRYPKKEKIILE